MVGIIMYGKIQELKQLGYKKQQTARELDIDTKTVRKYWDMSEDNFVKYFVNSKSRSSGMERYRDYILGLLQEHTKHYKRSLKSLSTLTTNSAKQSFFTENPLSTSKATHISIYTNSKTSLSPFLTFFNVR